MTIADEISKMTDLITANTAAPVTESSSTDAPGTEVPGTNAPGTESPGTNAPSTNAPKTDAPATEAPTTEAPVEESTKLREENALLEARIKKLEHPSTDAPGTTAPSTEAPIGEEDFVGDQDLDELTRDAGQLNKLLTHVFKKGIETVRSAIRQGDERVLLAVPEMTKKNIEIVSALKKASETFYDENKDLITFKKVVSLVFEKAVAKDSGKK